MQIHHKPSKILVVGMSGSGKSVFVTRYILNKKFDHIFIFDHKLEFLHRCGMKACFSVTELTEAMKRRDPIISYNHTNDFPGDSEAGFQFFSDWVFEMAKIIQRHCLYVCDEVNRFTSPQDMGWEFRQLIEDGRLQGLDFIGTSHAANHISGKLRLQLTEIVALRTKDSRALAFLEEIGFNGEEVSNLETGEFILYHEQSGKFVRDRLFASQIPQKEIDAGDETNQDGDTASNPPDSSTLPP